MYAVEFGEDEALQQQNRLDGLAAIMGICLSLKRFNRIILIQYTRQNHQLIKTY